MHLVNALRPRMASCDTVFETVPMQWTECPCVMVMDVDPFCVCLPFLKPPIYYWLQR